MPYNGTLVRGTASYTAGKFGNALSGAVYQIGAAGSPSVGTLETWVKVTSSSGTYVAVGDSSPNYPWLGMINGKAAFQQAAASSNTTSSVTIGDGLWHHLAMTMDGTNAKLWVDGALASTVASSSNFTIDSHLAIGGFDTPSTFDWPGQIDEVRYSNIVRYTGTTYTVPTAAFTDDTTTLALYHLEANCTDSHVGGNYNGVITRGTPSFTTGKFGNALSGAVYAISGIPSSPVGTVELWVKTTTTAIAVALGSDQSASFWVGATTNGKAAFQDVGQTTARASTISINDGAWHHLAVTVNGTSWILWVDGVSAYTASNTGALTFGTPNAIGGYGSTGTYDWPGQIDEVRVSNVVRYTSTFTPPSTAFTDDSSTVALYHLETDGTDSHIVSSGTIAPNDANIVYSPYTWDVTAARAKTINAGSYLSMELVGSATSIVANFDISSASSPLPQISYRIDSGPWTSSAIAASVTLTIPATNVWTKHFVELRVKSTTETVNRWNSPQNTAVAFTGLTVIPNTITTAVFRKKRFNILCYGDSITEGVRTLGSSQTYDTDRNDSALAWAFPLGALLGAEVGVVGFGATGLNQGGSGNVPALTSSYNMLWSGTSRIFTPVPDLIIINHGTNDSGDITANATTVLNGLLVAAPSAKIAVIQQWNGTTHKTQWQAAISGCSNPSQVTYVDTTGWWNNTDSSDSLHPYGYVNVTDLAPRLAAAVGPLLVGTVAPKRYVNVGGTAKAIQ